MKKIILYIVSFLIFGVFASNAYAIVDNTSTTNGNNQTVTTSTKKKFLKRVSTEKSEEIKTSHKEIVLKTQINESAKAELAPKVSIQDGSTLNLRDCIEIALKNSPSIRRYEDLVKTANALLGQSKSDYFPSLNLGTGYTGSYDHSSKNSTTPFDNSYGFNASISQLILSFGKVESRIKKARLNKIAADYDLNYEIIKTIFNVKTNYYAVLAAYANIKVQEANILINERQYQQTKAYFEEGLKSKIDLVNSEVNLSNAKINYVTAQNAYDVAVVELNNSMYIDGNPNYSIAKLESFNFDNSYAEVVLKNTKQEDVKAFQAPALADGAVYQTSVQKNELMGQSYNYKKFPYSLEESLSLAKENRPDLKSYISARDALKSELTYQKIQYLPNLNASGAYGFNALKDNNQTNSFQIKGSLDFPSINVMDIKNKINEAKARLDIADAQVYQLEKDIHFSVQKAYVNMIQYEQKLPLTEVTVKHTFENLELALGRYEVGLGNFLEVQDAIVNYNQAQENYVKLIFDYNVSVAKLELEIAKINYNEENTQSEKKDN